MAKIRTTLAMMALAGLVLAGCRSTPPPVDPTPTSPPASASPSPTATATPTSAPTRTSPPVTPRPTATATVAPTAPFPRSLLGKDVERIPTTRKVVALTFDAGANADAVASILATLKREGIKATFYLTGDFVVDFPEQAKRIAADGHRLGNHSVDHPHFTALSDAQVRAQLSNAAKAIRTATGANPAPLFRFPYGDRDARTIATVNAAGYVPVRWTVDSLGWQGTMDGSRSASFVVQRVLNAATPGEIVLMHVGSHPGDRSILDADALPSIISGLRSRGYTFVTLDVLL